MLGKIIKLAPFRSLEFANANCYECPTGTHGFYDAPASYADWLAEIGIESPPFADASPVYSQGDGWAIIEAHPDM